MCTFKETAKKLIYMSPYFCYTYSDSLGSSFISKAKDLIIKELGRRIQEDWFKKKLMKKLEDCLKSANSCVFDALYY